MRKVMQVRGAGGWRELVARQASSGLSVPAFCRREGLNAWTFYGWRSRLRARVADRKPSGSRAAVEESRAGFIDLGALGGASSRCEIRLDLGGGLVLQVVRG
jgi:putative transposase